MFKPLTVSISGPSFSFLLYENTKSNVRQEGFLLGEIIQKETKTITDNDQEQINVSKIIKINSVIPCPQSNYFYNGIGKIYESKIKSLLGEQFTKVVAWYKYHQMSSFKFTLREKVIHKQLHNLFEIPADLFTCCLLISETSDNSSTHTFSQTFVRHDNTMLENLLLHIPNLSEPNNTYLTAETASPTFNKILKELKINTEQLQGVVAITKIQNAVQKHTDSLVEDLSEAESRLYELQEELAVLLKKQRDEQERNWTDTKEETINSKFQDSATNNSAAITEEVVDVVISGPKAKCSGRGRVKRRNARATKFEKDVNVERAIKSANKPN